MQQPDDSDSDSDYVPGKEGKHGSDTESDGEGDGAAKRLRLDEEVGEENAEERKAREQRERELLWKSFKEDTSTSSQRKETAQPKMIKIVKTMRFAGEDVKQVVEVLEDSKEAKQWPRFEETTPHSGDQPESPSQMQAVTPLHPPANQQLTSGTYTSSAPDPTSSAPAIPSAAPTPKPAPGPGPRKRKTLGAIPTTKPRKLTTLDKGMMDWSSHLSSSTSQHMRDELEANRRGGGYIERVEFMERVSERKEEGRQQLAGSKRRR